MTTEADGVRVPTSGRPSLPSPVRPSALHPAGPPLALALALAGAVLLILMWWRGAPPAVGPGADLTDAGRLMGLLAGYVAVLQVVLRARIPLIERTLGTDRINVAHRLLGSYLLAAVAAHAALITAGYSRASGTSVTRQVRVLVTSYSFVAWAVVAAGILLTAGVTAVPGIRRRLRYEAWHAVHALVYPAIALAFFHQVTIGEHLAHHRVLRWAWTLMFAAVGGAALWYRWVRPLCLAVRHRLTVAAVHRESSGVVSIVFKGRRLASFPGEPGQYFRWRFLTRRSWYAAHPYSLSAEPDGRRLRITATVHGHHSSLLPDLLPGTRVIAEGPCGGLLGDPRWRGPVLLIAGGIGVTPLRALFAALPSAHTTLIYRAHTSSELLFRSELDRLAADHNATVHYLLGSRAETGNSLSPERLTALCADIHQAQIYICGSAGFVGQVRTSLARLAVPQSQIHSEAFQL